MKYVASLSTRRRAVNKESNAINFYRNSAPDIKKQLWDASAKELDRIQAEMEALDLLDIKNCDSLRRKYIDNRLFELLLKEEDAPSSKYYISDDNLVTWLTEMKVSRTYIPDLFEKYKGKYFLVYTHKVGYTIYVDDNIESIVVETDEGTISSVRIFFASCRKETIAKKIDIPALKFGINLLFYMDAFPESIKSGLPKDIVGGEKKMLQKLNGRRNVIGTVEEFSGMIVKTEHGAVMPHRRCGHFMFFRSDRYVNMKGKSVWVKETIVKGHLAKTVTDVNKE